MSLRNRQVLIHKDNTSPRYSSTNDKDEFLETTKKIVKEEIENHEKKVCKSIKTHLENMNIQLDRISQEVFKITKSLEFTQGQLDKELTKIKNEIGKPQAGMKKLDEDLLDPDFVIEKLIELEDRLQQNHLRMGCVEETPNEAWDVCKEKVQGIIKEELVITAEIELDNCHCTGKLKKINLNQEQLSVDFCDLKTKKKILKIQKN